MIYARGAQALPDMPMVSDEVCVWDINLQSFILFSRLLTQWNHTNGMKTGLDYVAAFKLMDEFFEMSKEDRAEMFDDLQSMELAALDQMHADMPKD